MLGIKFTDNTCERLNIHRTLQEKKKRKVQMYCTGGRAHGYTFPFQVQSLKCYIKSLALNKPKNEHQPRGSFRHRKIIASKICWLAEQFHSQQSEDRDSSSSMCFNELPVNPNNSWNIKAAQVLWFTLCTLWSVIHSLALKSLRNKAELWCYPLITAVWNKPNVGNQTVWLSNGEPSATQNHLGFSVRCSQWLVWTLWS